MIQVAGSTDNKMAIAKLPAVRRKAAVLFSHVAMLLAKRGNQIAMSMDCWTGISIAIGSI